MKDGDDGLSGDALSARGGGPADIESVLWDVAIIGSGPAGSAAAIAAIAADPSARVLLLDRAEFPRDKCCGDGVLASGVRELAAYGIDADALVRHYGYTHELRLTSARGVTVSRRLPDAMAVIPRAVFDERLHRAARDAGAHWQRRAVRSVRDRGEHVELDGVIRARVVIGADGVESVARRCVSSAPRQLAVAIRGYSRSADQAVDGDRVPTMVLDERVGLAYAWRFPAADGTLNIGYGHLLRAGESASRRDLLAGLSRLLPGANADPGTLRAHRLPLSTSRQLTAGGRVLLAGDAAALVNPISGEGIYYAITSGLAAGRVAVQAPAQAARRYRHELRRRFARHQRHVAVLARLSGYSTILEAAIRAAEREQRVFDDLAAIGLAHGAVTRAFARGLLVQLARP